MSKREQNAQALSSIMSGNKSGYLLFTAQVESVQGNTCTVVVDGLPLSGVRLSPTTTESNDKILLTPAIESFVLVGSLSGDLNNLSVLSCDIVQSIEVTSNGQNLGSLISDLIDTIANAVIFTPAGNGSFDPTVITQLNSIKTSFKQIFK